MCSKKMQKMCFLPVWNHNVSSFGFLEVPNETVVHSPSRYSVLLGYLFACAYGIESICASNEIVIYYGLVL